MLERSREEEGSREAKRNVVPHGIAGGHHGTFVEARGFGERVATVSATRPEPRPPAPPARPLEREPDPAESSRPAQSSGEPRN